MAQPRELAAIPFGMTTIVEFLSHRFEGMKNFQMWPSLTLAFRLTPLVSEFSCIEPSGYDIGQLQIPNEIQSLGINVRRSELSTAEKYSRLESGELEDWQLSHGRI